MQTIKCWEACAKGLIMKNNALELFQKHLRIVLMSPFAKNKTFSS